MRETPLAQTLKVKDKELSHFISVNNKFKKKKEELQKELDQKVKMNEINDLTSQINLAKVKLKNLEQEKKDLEIIKKIHENCEKEKSKIESEINKLKKNLDELRKQNKIKEKQINEKGSKIIKGKNKISIVDEKNMTEEELKKYKEQKVQRISNQINKFWQKNAGLLEEQNTPPDVKEANKKKKKKIELNVNMNKLKEEKFNKKLNYAQELRNEEIINGVIADKVKKKKEENNENNENENINSTELPKISSPLFNQNEKKVLGNIIPEKEINKYEKRYEFLDKEKNNLLRKHAFETKKLEKEKMELQKKFNLGNSQLIENQNKNKKLEKQISDQEKEIESLKEKLENMKKELDQKKKEVEAKEAENKKLLENMKKIQNNQLDFNEMNENEI